MQEIKGNLWDYYGKPNHIVCITTNCSLKSDLHTAVMGKGIAKEALDRFPGIDLKLGNIIRKGLGSRCFELVPGVWSFPTKNDWRQPSFLEFIDGSARSLRLISTSDVWRNHTFIIPRPGCGCGGLDWRDVKLGLELIFSEDRFKIISY